MLYGHESHPDEAKLSAFDQGQLPSAEWVEIEGRVAACETCCGKLENMREDKLVALLRAAVGSKKAADTTDSPSSGGETIDAPRVPGPARAEIPPELAAHP